MLRAEVGSERNWGQLLLSDKEKLNLQHKKPKKPFHTLKKLDNLSLSENFLSDFFFNWLK